MRRGASSTTGDSRPSVPGLRAEIDPANFASFYTPKWGNEAAALLFRQKYWLRFVTLICALGCLLVLAAALPAWGLLFALVLAAPPAARAAHYARRVSAAASSALGVEVRFGGFRGPPRHHGPYLRWCSRRGLAPYQAG